MQALLSGFNLWSSSIYSNNNVSWYNEGYVYNENVNAHGTYI
jgi:hypothetical protein